MRADDYRVHFFFFQEVKRGRRKVVVFSFSLMHRMKRERKKTDGRSSTSRKTP